MEKKITMWRDNARIDVRFSVQKGKIADFSINVSYEKDGEVIDAYRADTEHGFLHGPTQGGTRSPLSSAVCPNPPYNEAFESLYEYAKKHADEMVE